MTQRRYLIVGCCILILVQTPVLADTYEKHITFDGGYRDFSGWQPYSEQIDFGVRLSSIDSLTIRLVGWCNAGSRYVEYYEYDPVLGTWTDRSYWTPLPSALVGSLDGLSYEWVYDTHSQLDHSWTFTKLRNATALASIFDGAAALNLRLEMRPDQPYLYVQWPDGYLYDVYITLQGTPSIVPEPTSLLALLTSISVLAVARSTRVARLR